MPLRDLNSLKAINVGDMPPAGWYPDPTGRPEGCYWNGSAWEPRKVRPTKRSLDDLLHSVFICSFVSAATLLIATWLLLHGTSDPFFVDQVMVISGVAEAIGAALLAVMYFQVRRNVGRSDR
jgi:hypothetical protein